MKLKTRVATLEEVPESYRDKYTAAEDGKSFTLDEFEFDDAVGLKANQERLLKQLKAAQEAEKKLKETYGDLDPVKAREAQKKLDELENSKLMDEGKFEELFAKRTEAMKRDHDNQKKAMAEAMDAEKQRGATLEQQLQRLTIANELNTHAGKLKIKSEFIPFLQLAAKEAWSLDEQGNPVWKEKDQVKFGKDGSKPATMEEYLQELVANTPSLLESSTGTGAHGNGSRGMGPLSISRSDMRDINKYAAVKAQAVKQGVPIEKIQITE